MKNSKKAALYVRVSTRYQIDKDSLPFQRKKLKEYCQLMNIENYEIFEDDGFSGKNTDRPQYKKMMSELRKGNLSHIIVWEVDRISRNLLDFASMYNELKKYRTIFISMNEQFDTSTAIGEAMLKIILVFAELERNMTSERVTSIMLNRAESGLWNGARMPIGYKWDEKLKYPVPDADEAETVQYIFDKYESTHSCLKVSRMLNNNHIRTKRGGEWTSKVVNDVLKNPFYIGTYRYNLRESGKGALKPESEWIVKENNHEAIIDKEQFERCNSIIAQNAKRDTSALRMTKYVHVFSHKLRCNICGTNFIASKDKTRANGFKPSIYRCGRRAKMMDCDSKTISDITVGAFVFNYISNIVRAQKSIAKLNSLEKFEKSLLKGEEFKDIANIDTMGLQQMYMAILYKSADKTSLSFNFLADKIPTVDTTEIEILTKERDKHKKAAERLLDIYLYDSSTMSKSELTEKRKNLQQKIEDLNQKIDNLMNNNAADTDTLDLAFIKKATAFLISQKILSTSHIDYIKLSMASEPEILKDFVNQIIDTITIDNGKVSKIKFTNGIEHTFTYK